MPQPAFSKTQIDDDDNIAADGEIIRVKMTLMDHALRHHFADKARRAMRQTVVDAFGDPAGFRPGFVGFDQSVNDEAVDQAWDEQTTYLQNAWKRPTTIEATSSTKPPTELTTDALRSIADREWLAQGARLRDAWRTP